MKKIKDIPKIDRPREKMQQKGAAALSDLELIQVLVGSGVSGSDVQQIAKKVVNQLREGTNKITLDALCEIKGLGMATSSRIAAAIEIANRFVHDNSVRIENPKDALSLLTDIRNKKQEYLVAITLDGAGRIIEKRVVFVGTLNASLIHPREVFADAITDRAAKIVIAHNHPSGSAQPSTEDLEVTKQLMKSGSILGIKLFDHIIVTKENYISFKEKEIIF